LRVSNDFEITNSPVQEVDLVVTGDKRKIDQLNLRDLVASVDLTDVQAGERTVLIAPENVSVELPTGVRLEEIQPNKIAVKLEAVEEREITVRAETEGSVAENYEIYSKTIVPAKVRARGPESFIKSLDFVSTERINLENQQSDFIVRQVALNVANPKVTLLDTAVNVNFKVGERRIERLFVVPVQIEGANKSATVVLFGGRSVMESLKQEDIQVDAIKDEAGKISLNLVLPARIQEQTEIRKLNLN
jgi:YbbR domain-containing protein